MSNEESKELPNKAENLPQKGKWGTVIAKWHTISKNIPAIGCFLFFGGIDTVACYLFIKNPDSFDSLGLLFLILGGVFAFFPFLRDAWAQRDPGTDTLLKKGLEVFGKGEKLYDDRKLEGKTTSNNPVTIINISDQDIAKDIIDRIKPGGKSGDS